MEKLSRHLHDSTPCMRKNDPQYALVFPSDLQALNSLAAPCCLLMSRHRERYGSHWPSVLLAPTSASTSDHSLTANHQSEEGGSFHILDRFPHYTASLGYHRPSSHSFHVVSYRIACLDRSARLRRTRGFPHNCHSFTILSHLTPPSGYSRH
jgi:hypothetical protein